ncbi:MAG: hypothetical protein M3297_14300 [Thermoproteota archaeon]|jgi:hypothetical protein|nr:hypothetical protein [Thermoproteota archaeon]
MTDNSIDNKYAINKGYMNSALGTALYILRCVDGGQNRNEIVQGLETNEQHVTVWIQYLKAISWLKEDNQGNLLASEDGKLRIQQYEKAISSRLHDTNSISQQLNKSKYQEEIILSQSTYAELIETTLAGCWNYYWWWILPLSNTITETYTAAVFKLLDNTRSTSKAVNEVLSAI